MGTAPPPEVQAQIDARVDRVRGATVALLADGPVPLREVWETLKVVDADGAIRSRALAGMLSEKRTRLDALRWLRLA